MTIDSDEPLSNPYQPPLEPLPTRKAASRDLVYDWPTLLGWPPALAINLFVPMIIAWDITSRGGRIGMWLAIGTFLIFGWVLCFLSRPTARRLVIGSVALAFTQFFPMIQLIAGILAFGITNVLTMSNFPSSMSEELSDVTVFIVTSIVGICLSAVAYVLGLTIFAIASAWRGQTPAPQPTTIDKFQIDDSDT